MGDSDEDWVHDRHVWNKWYSKHFNQNQMDIQQPLIGVRFRRAADDGSSNKNSFDPKQVIEAYVENITPLMLWTIIMFWLVCIVLPLLFLFDYLYLRPLYRGARVAPEDVGDSGDSDDVGELGDIQAMDNGEDIEAKLKYPKKYSIDSEEVKYEDIGFALKPKPSRQPTFQQSSRWSEPLNPTIVRVPTILRLPPPCQCKHKPKPIPKPAPIKATTAVQTEEIKRPPCKSTSIGKPPYMKSGVVQTDGSNREFLVEKNPPMMKINYSQTDNSNKNLTINQLRCQPIEIEYLPYKPIAYDEPPQRTDLTVEKTPCKPIETCPPCLKPVAVQTDSTEEFKNEVDPCFDKVDKVAKKIKDLSWFQMLEYAQADGGWYNENCQDENQQHQNDDTTDNKDTKQSNNKHDDKKCQ